VHLSNGIPLPLHLRKRAGSGFNVRREGVKGQSPSLGFSGRTTAAGANVNTRLASSRIRLKILRSHSPVESESAIPGAGKGCNTTPNLFQFASAFFRARKICSS